MQLHLEVVLNKRYIGTPLSTASCFNYYRHGFN